MVARTLHAMSPEVYIFGSARAEDQSPTGSVKHDHRDSFPMHENHIHASNTLRSHPLSALLEQHLPGHDYALVTCTPQGHYETVASHNWQAKLDQIYCEQFRTKLGYSRRPDYPLRTMSMPQRGSYGPDYDDYQDEYIQGSRKRARTRSQAINKSPPQGGVRISDRAAIRAFYERCFKDFQQQGCKIFGKAWVKMMEPKKQSNHPYVKGNQTGKAPPWWPKTEGGKAEAVRHKEPDHLGKQERIVLFCHILEIIIDPRHPSRPRRGVSHPQEVSIAELESVTDSSLADFYATSQKNATKAGFMEDLFVVAKLDERFRRGELSPDYIVHTSQVSRTSESDPEDENEREMYTTHQIGASGIATPDTMVSAQDASHFRGPEMASVDGYGAYSGMREPTYARYGGHLPPTPEDNQPYALSSPENYPPQPAPVGYPQSVTAYHMQEARRPSWQPTEYNPGQQLPPLNHTWSHSSAPMISSIQMSQYGGWSAPAQQQPQASTLLPPMHAPLQEQQQQQQAYQENPFMKCEGQVGQQT